MAERYTALFVWPDQAPPELHIHAPWNGGVPESIQFSDLFEEAERMRIALQRIAGGWGVSDLEGAIECAERALGRHVNEAPP